LAASSARYEQGEARNAWGPGDIPSSARRKIRDRNFEQQRYHASGLNLVVAAIVLWNTVYLERAVRALKAITSRWTKAFAAHVTLGGHT
jgi:TnpA family transposase